MQSTSQLFTMKHKYDPFHTKLNFISGLKKKNPNH